MHRNIRQNPFYVGKLIEIPFTHPRDRRGQINNGYMNLMTNFNRDHHDISQQQAAFKYNEVTVKHCVNYTEDCFIPNLITSAIVHRVYIIAENSYGR